MARRRREVEVFTMSSLNMLSKALGAVILLFIIIPKVTVKDKEKLKRLPPELDMIICDSTSLKVVRGDSVLIQHKFDSVENQLKSQIAIYDSLLNKLQCIRAHLKIDKKEAEPQKAIAATSDNNNTYGSGIKLKKDEIIVNKNAINSSDCSNDTQAPTFNNCPENIVKTTANNCANAAWTTPTATDNCGASAVTVASSPTAGLLNGACFPTGTTVITYTAKDLKGNQNQCSFTVTVNKSGSAQASADNKGDGNSSGSSIVSDIPFPCVDPVTIYLEWLGDKDARVDLSAKNTTTGGWSGYKNFNSSASWMKYHTNKRGSFKYFTQDPLNIGDYEIYAHVRSGKGIKVKGAAVLKSADGSKILQNVKISEKDLSNDKGGTLIGTLRITTNSLSFKN
jgi:HYR domain